MSIAGTSPKAPILPMSWLDWERDGDEYAGGSYRIRLIEPHRWEALREGKHIFYDTRLSNALVRTEEHYRNRLRVRDLFTWSAVFAASILLVVALDKWRDNVGLWGYLLLVVAMFASMSAVVRFYAAATGNRFDPYRRRAPWEKRRRWGR